ncbi:hypothetical protein [Microtetraspora malaysiensis]|uniref:hypothetical protein n=1 Tax=Microtetraspora malaysiensis TaxID=161358 RepID=UPI003D93C5D6
MIGSHDPVFQRRGHSTAIPDALMAWCRGTAWPAWTPAATSDGMGLYAGHGFVER